jgi:hypothetical protein
VEGIFEPPVLLRGALRGGEPLKIRRATSHTSLSTTRYIRIAEDAGRGADEPFPVVPAIILGPQLTAAETKHLAQTGPSGKSLNS